MRGRIRSVKPEVLTDEDLWDLGQRTGFPIYQGYQGLWLYADREGRFEWRVRPLKSLILPYWEGDFSLLLDALAEAGFVQRYEVDGKTYGHVRTFGKHQTPNAREPESTIPAPPSARARTCTHVQNDDASGARTVQKVSSGNGNGTERNGNGTLAGAPPREGSQPLNLPRVAHDALAANANVPPVGADAPDPELEPGEPEYDGPRVRPSDLSELVNALKAAYATASVGKMPELTRGHQATVLRHVKGLVELYPNKTHGLIIADLCRAADPASTGWVHELARRDPYAPQPRPSGYAPRNPRASPGTTAEDHSSYAKPIADQLAQFGSKRG
jgi:hypothetical protein